MVIFGLLAGCTSGGSDSGNTNGVMLSDITVTNDTLVIGATTSISVSLQHSDLTPYENVTNISFSTSCPSSVIDPMVVATSAGTATATYTAGICTGTDTITATATVNGEQISNARAITIVLPPSSLLFGSGYAGTFEQGVLQSTIGNTATGQPAIVNGGNTSVLASIVDSNNAFALFTDASFNVSFSSPCTASGTATLTTPVLTNGGYASSIYTANGCVGDDTVTAVVNINGVLHVANVILTTLPTTLSAIEFLSLSSDKIALAGSGSNLQETAQVNFKVLSSVGDPVEGQTVNFSLDTSLGGVSLSTSSVVTGADGIASTTLQSGTVYTNVRVLATTTDANTGIPYGIQSDPILITSGMTDAEKFSLSIADCNPGGAYENDGVTVDVSVSAWDYFDELVPDGTSIYFRTEGGSIDSSCQTVNGSCSVIWASQNPRPMESGQEGRSTILAYVVGSETFDDSNGNDVYDDADPDFTVSHSDLPEAWVDSNENGSHDSATEEFIDFNTDGSYNAADSHYTGVLCQRTGGTAPGCGATSLHISRSGVIHMASNNNSISIDGGNGNNIDFNLPLSTDTPLTVTIVVNSTTGQYPATGTSITVETNNGIIVGNSNFVVPDNCNTAPGEGYQFTIDILGDGTGGTDTLMVTTTSNATQSQQTVNVTDQTE